MSSTSLVVVAVTKALPWEARERMPIMRPVVAWWRVTFPARVTRVRATVPCSRM